MTFGRYASLADEDVWPAALSGELAGALRYSDRVLARSLGREGFEALLKSPVGAIENAPAVDDRFPLVVIGQGLYYESPITFATLAEELAEQGYVVATCPLVGTRSPIVRMDLEDLDTQVRDLEFVIGRARKLPFVDPEKLGVLGFDMGGMSALILSMRNPGVDALLTLSSDILYRREDGVPFDSPSYEPSALRAPWLHSVPANWLKSADQGQKRLYDQARFSSRYLLLTENFGHVDYTSYALIPGRKPASGYWAAASDSVASGHKVIQQYVQHFLAAYLKNSASDLEFLRREPEETFPGWHMTIEYREGEPPPISYEEFVREVVAGNGELAVRKARSLQQLDSRHILLQDYYLERLIWSLRDTWGLNQRIMPVIRFRAELHPQSEAAQVMLAEGLISIREYGEAMGVYEELLERNPENHHVSARLNWLRSQLSLPVDSMQ